MYLFYHTRDTFWMIFSAFADQYIITYSSRHSHFFRAIKVYNNDSVQRSDFSGHSSCQEWNLKATPWAMSNILTNLLHSMSRQINIFLMVIPFIPSHNVSWYLLKRQSSERKLLCMKIQKLKW